MGNRLSGVELGEAFLDLGQEDETLYRVFVGRIGGKFPQSLEDSLLGSPYGHAVQVSMAIERSEGRDRTRRSA